MPPAIYDGAFVIGINDAEAIYPADVTIFHENWVLEALAHSGFRSKVYLTSVAAPMHGQSVVRLAFEPLENDEADLMLSRLQDADELSIEQYMFLTGLEVARNAAVRLGRHLDVYMVGFDFSPDGGYSKAIDTSPAPAMSEARRASISIQSDVLRNAIYALRGSPISVLHVGSRDFSALSVEAVVERFALRAVGPAQASDGVPEVLITAEITTNHFGDRGRLEQLVRLAHGAGADLVKVQKRDVETFYSAKQLSRPYASPFGETFGDYRRALELGREDFEYLSDLCSSLGMSWFASVLDEPSFRYMADFGAPLLKLPSTISEHTDYLQHVAENYRGPLVLSTGMTDQSYEDWVLSTFGGQEKLYLLHCNSAYPTPDEDCNIGVVRHYSELAQQHPNLVPGYSSHDHGSMASALAVAAGAGMVEKHVKLGNTEWAHFDAVAVDLTTPAFKEYVEDVRRAQLYVGSTRKTVTASEHHKYRR